MKLMLLLAAVFTLFVSAENCSKTKEAPVYKGRLAVAGNCMNYTIELLEGNMDTNLYVADWTDEMSGQSYQNVFRLGSVCNFPATIKQGDEFYFDIDNTAPNDCAVCLAYYPTPAKSIPIKVVQR